ncbi:MAG: CDP-diacylglycerol--serine O-phosphatidyltransferase, partial [Pseudomonadota bacterium]|nr:CDP-diacylglycerol--serine O-phosphatidyltransferase [Pseudomonadota bacterium]
AAVIICYAWVIIDTGMNVESFKWLSLILLIFLSTLMVTNITYYSFKDIDLRQKVPHISLFVIVIVLSFISFDPPLVLLSFFSIYALSGPSLFLLRLFRKRSINTRERRSER